MPKYTVEVNETYEAHYNVIADTKEAAEAHLRQLHSDAALCVVDDAEWTDSDFYVREGTFDAEKAEWDISTPEEPKWRPLQRESLFDLLVEESAGDAG